MSRDAEDDDPDRTIPDVDDEADLEDSDDGTYPAFLRALAAPPTDSRRGSTNAELRLGAVFRDRYHIEREIGRGGVGVVYEAQDLTLGRTVAIKMLLSEGEDDALASRFVREARVVAMLQSEHVARVLDVGHTESGAQFIVMEFLQGTDLAKYLREKQSLPVEEASDILMQVCDALSEAHALGVVHRDIKPGNLFLTERADGSRCVKVIDFGLAKNLMFSRERGSLDTGLAILGTPAHMAPEQLVGESVDERTDIWALGTVLYELLTGERPFAGANLFEIGAMIRERPAPRISSPRVPGALAQVVDRCLAKEPADRFADVAELAESLVPFVSQEERSLAKRVRRTLEKGRVRADVRPHEGDDASLSPLGPPRTFRDRRRRSWKSRLWPVVVALGAGGGVWAFMHYAAEPVGRPSPSGAAPGSTTPPVMPPTAPSKGLAKYQEAMRYWRDGYDESVVRRTLGEAVALDEQLAVAWLRLALIEPWDETPADIAQAYRKAQNGREHLSEQDQGLLEAAKKMLTGPDLGGVRAILEHLIDQNPADVELWYHLVNLHFNAGDYERALEAAQKAFEKDSSFVIALALQAEALAYLGRASQARDIVANCLSVAPTATLCRSVGELIETVEGKCDAVLRHYDRPAPSESCPIASLEIVAAAQVARDPRNGRGAAKAWLDQKTVCLRKSGESPMEAKLDIAKLHLFFGEFRRAEQLLVELRTVTDEPTLRNGATVLYLQLLQELSEGKQFRTELELVGNEYVPAAMLESPPMLLEDYAIASDGAPVAILATRDVRPSWPTDLMRWLERWKVVSSTSANQGYLWVHGKARLATTGDEARQLIEDVALKRVVVPSYFPQMQGEAILGRLYASGGRPEDALLELRKATKRCDGMLFPVEHQQAWLALGQVHEARGNKAEACRAYGTVLARWNEGSGTRSSRAAAEGSLRLTCSPPPR